MRGFERSTSLIKGKMSVKFTGSASRMHAKTSSCRIGRGVRLEDRTAGWRSGVVSLEESDSCASSIVIAGTAREAEDDTWSGASLFIVTLGTDKMTMQIFFHITWWVADVVLTEVTCRIFGPSW